MLETLAIVVTGRERKAEQGQHEGAAPFNSEIPLLREEILMQHIVCGDYSAEIFPIYRNWVGQALE